MISADAPVAVAQHIVQAPAAGSISMALVQDGKLLYVRSVGNAKENTAYRIGSVTKTFTATSILQLADAGKLSLDDSVTRFFSQYAAWKNVTVRQLLNHTSGIPNYLDTAIANGRVNSPTTPQTILLEASVQPLDFAPGSDWNYSNTNYVLLGQIVEKVARTTLDAYERTHIFTSAGMSKTAFGAAAPGTALAKPLEVENSVLIDTDPGDATWYYACGDIVSTADDVARFDAALMDGTILSHAALATMQQTVPFWTVAPNEHDGLGVFVQPFGSLTRVAHHGGEPGFRSDNELIPSRNFAFVVFGNGDFSTEPIVGAALTDAFPRDALVARSAKPAGEPDPQMTAKHLLFARKFFDGQIDRSELDSAMNAALTDAELRALRAQFAPYGRLKKFRFVSRSYQRGMRMYVYDATFENRRVPILIWTNAQGKYSGVRTQ